MTKTTFKLFCVHIKFGLMNWKDRFLSPKSNHNKSLKEESQFLDLNGIIMVSRAHNMCYSQGLTLYTASLVIYVKDWS